MTTRIPAALSADPVPAQRLERAATALMQTSTPRRIPRRRIQPDGRAGRLRRHPAPGPRRLTAATGSVPNGRTSQPRPRSSRWTRSA